MKLKAGILIGIVCLCCAALLAFARSTANGRANAEKVGASELEHDVSDILIPQIEPAKTKL
jgi:hypothetical protein